ncbi:hypothetical protein U1Q18_032715 [Sarracenia purpurea var. burkii]
MTGLRVMTTLIRRKKWKWRIFWSNRQRLRGWMKAKSGLAPGGDGFPIGSLVILCSLVEIVSGNGPLGQTSKFVKGLWGSPTIQGRWSMVMRVEMGDIQLLIITAG